MKKNSQIIAVGYMAVWPTRKLVKVKVEPCQHVFPFLVSPIDPNEKELAPFPIAKLSSIRLYKTLEQGEKIELNKIHKEYSAERRALRVQQQRYKWALRRIEDYKHFGSLQQPFFQMI